MVFLVVDDLKERNGNEKQSELSYYPYTYIITHGMASYGK